MKYTKDLYKYLTIGLLGFVVFYIAPFCLSLLYSMVDSPLTKSFVGLKNYGDLLKNPAYLLGLKNTLRFIFTSVPLNLMLSLFTALLMGKVGKSKKIFSLLFLIPFVLPSGAISFFWLSFFRSDGILNGLLHTFGVSPINWLNSNVSFYVMVCIFLWKNLGYNMVLFQAGLSNVPQDQYEAGRVDGAHSWQLFRYITLPHLRSTLLLTTLMSIINSFKVFKEIYLLTGNYPHESIYTLQHFMNNMFKNLSYSRLTTATTIFTLFIVALTQVLFYLQRKGEV